jgi:hypothetical protein
VSKILIVRTLVSVVAVMGGEAGKEGKDRERELGRSIKKPEPPEARVWVVLVTLGPIKPGQTPIAHPLGCCSCNRRRRRL